LHSNKTQAARLSILEGFKYDRIRVLVATDIAARGLDIEAVSHVVNYDVPSHPEDYVHRIGRTGRASSTGDAFTIVTAAELRELTHIEAFIGATIPRMKLEGFNYVYTALLDPEVQKKNARKGFGRFGRR
jgi:ATP-dependent RNA helicase RhlE